MHAPQVSVSGRSKTASGSTGNRGGQEGRRVQPHPAARPGRRARLAEGLTRRAGPTGCTGARQGPETIRKGSQREDAGRMGEDAGPQGEAATKNAEV